MLAEDRDALICDLAETYHVLDMWALPVPVLAALASGLRDNSRIKMKIAKLRHIPLEFVLPKIYDQLAVIFSEKGKKPRLLTDVMTMKKGHKKRDRTAGFRTVEDFEVWHRRTMMGGTDHG